METRKSDIIVVVASNYQRTDFAHVDLIDLFLVLMMMHYCDEVSRLLPSCGNIILRRSVEK